MQSAFISICSHTNVIFTNATRHTLSVICIALSDAILRNTTLSCLPECLWYNSTLLTTNKLYTSILIGSSPTHHTTTCLFHMPNDNVVYFCDTHISHTYLHVKNTQTLNIFVRIRAYFMHDVNTCFINVYVTSARVTIYQYNFIRRNTVELRTIQRNCTCTTTFESPNNFHLHRHSCLSTFVLRACTHYTTCACEW